MNVFKKVQLDFTEFPNLKDKSESLSTMAFLQHALTRDVHWFALSQELEANQADLPGSKVDPNRLRYLRIKANPNQT